MMPAPRAGSRSVIAALLGLALLTPQAHAQSQWRPQPEQAPKAALPKHLTSLATLPEGSTQAWTRSHSAKGGPWRIQLPNGSSHTVEWTHRVEHANGDISYSGLLSGADGRFGIVYTEGPAASFGAIETPDGRYRFESHAKRGWLVDLGHPQLREAAGAEAVSASALAPASEFGSIKSSAESAKNLDTVLDLLVLYSEGFAARYPGGIAQTRINHLMAVSNQILANSGMSLGLRLVGAERSAYPDSEGPNSSLLNALRAAVSGQVTHPSLSGLRARRAELGADLVSFMRPHDAETRGSCGIAYLFGDGANSGVNVVGDGFSSWSLCADEVLVHEIGHNLGAEHQNGANSPGAGFGTAHVLPGRLHTVMGSFGSGQPDRYRRLPRFSNPQMRCGGAPCGVANVSDNARRIRQNMAEVAAYQPARSSLPLPPQWPAQNPDTDGDGVSDSDDAFPFEPAYSADRDGDGVADPIDAWPDDRFEWTDTDGDGIGDNLDPDRDNDGFINALDALPLDRLEWNDRDGDGVGDNGDRFPNDPGESRDSDDDGIGDFADLDRDGDGRADLRPATAPTDLDLLVISAGTDRLLRLRGDSGVYAGVELAPRETPQAFGFQSALAWNPAQKQVLALINTQLRQYERAEGQLAALALGYPGGPRPALPSAFPAGLAVAADGTVFIADEATRGVYRRQAISARDLPGGQFGRAGQLSDAPRGLALAPGGRLWLLQRDGRLREYDASSGAQLREWLPAAVDGAVIAEATALAFDAGRMRLLVADAPNHRVLAVDPTSGAATTLVPRGAGGVSAPSGLAVDASGSLYVSSAGSHRVLRFDGASGTSLGEFDQVPGARLREPRGLLLVPRVDDRFPKDAQRQLRPSAGAWYNPARSGHGFDIQNTDGSVSVVWYSFDSTGAPTWYLAVGPLVDARLQTDLLRFRWQAGLAQPSVVGRVDLVFEREDRARFGWTLGALSGEETIQPLWLGGTEESAFPTAAWFPPSESGWGLSIARGGDIYTAIAFLYDEAGHPTWAAGPIRAAGDVLEFGLLRFVGVNLCPGCVGPTSTVVSPAGPLRMSEISDDAARIELDLQLGDTRWQRSALSFRRLTGTPSTVEGDPRP